MGCTRKPVTRPGEVQASFIYRIKRLPRWINMLSSTIVKLHPSRARTRRRGLTMAWRMCCVSCPRSPENWAASHRIEHLRHGSVLCPYNLEIASDASALTSASPYRASGSRLYNKAAAVNKSCQSDLLVTIISASLLT